MAQAQPRLHVVDTTSERARGLLGPSGLCAQASMPVLDAHPPQRTGHNDSPSLAMGWHAGFDEEGARESRSEWLLVLLFKLSMLGVVLSIAAACLYPFAVLAFMVYAEWGFPS